MEREAHSITPAEPISPRPGRRSLSRRILSGSAWMMVGRLASMGSLIFMQVVLARSWSHAKENYSAYLTAASVVPLMSMLATLGVPWTLVRILRS
jgi:O-antigen/teichoic acid export membrane protein